jgi:DNA-binding transcriptional LysR family regulator
MDFRRLTYFVAVAEELHFGRAASRLSIAQPPLSRQIAQLEGDLGVLLFDRSRSQIRLTQAGSLLLERARDLLESHERTELDVKRIGEGISGHLRIAFVGSATYGVLTDILKEFRLEYPDVELSLSVMNNAELKRAVIQREIDIAIARPSLDDEELKRVPLIHEPLILALPDTSVLLRNRSIRLVALRDETFILYPRKPRPTFADYILGICVTEGFVPKSQVLVQDFLTAIALVSVGVGILLVPESASHPRNGVTYSAYEGHNPGTSLSLNFRRDNRTPHLINFQRIAERITRSEHVKESRRG